MIYFVCEGLYSALLTDGFVSLIHCLEFLLGSFLHIFAKGGYTDKEAERNILSNPFKRFEDMQMLKHTKTLGIVRVDEAVWKHLTAEEKVQIESICNEKLEQYYKRVE